MNNQRDEILQNLIAKYPYIEYAALFSDQAELLNQPVGHWLEEQEENIELMVGKILYVFRELSSQLNKNEIEREEIKQVWLKLSQGNFIFVRCKPDIFLVVKTNDKGFLGELRKVIDSAAKRIREVWESEDILSLNSQDISVVTQVSFEKESQKNIPENNKLNSSAKLRGRDFIE
jgi:predicted regulator of Ras-like GTPase activity (Roadblock/LC7/MglB family)